MNELVFVRTLIDDFTEQLIKFCKPLMTTPDLRKDVALLLNSESNLRMTVEFACEAKDSDELLRKLLLSIEEISVISEILKKTNFPLSIERTHLQEKAFEIKEILENICQSIKE